MENETRKPSLRERILAATTKQEVAELLQEGATYKFASNSTRARWYKAALRRKSEGIE